MTQGYGWLLAGCGSIALISKDGAAWQSPGGKPLPGESLRDASAREFHEEAALQLPRHGRASFLGSFLIEEECNESSRRYLESRYLVRDLAEQPLRRVEPAGQAAEDVVRFAV